MKKIINIILLSLLIILISCKEEEIVYQDGDRITYNGVIYEYDIITFTEDRVLDAPTYDYKNPEQAIYHQAYYLDMLHPENYVDISDVYLYGWTKPSKSSTFYEFIKASDKFDTDYYGYYESFISNIGFLDGDYVLENIDGKINSGIEGTIYNPLCLWYQPYHNHYDETYSLVGQLVLENDVYSGLWWVVGIEDGITEVNIPKEIDGFEVAGIGYNAISNKHGLSICVEETDSKIPFIIMPLGINNSKLDKMDVHRKTVLSSYAFSNVDMTGPYFKDLAVVGAGFYKVNADNLEIEHLLIDENDSPEYGNSILVISGYIDPLFKDCDIKKLKCPQIIVSETNVFYLYSNNIYGLQSIRLCSNGTKPKTLYLGEGYLDQTYIKNSEIKSFIAEQELYSDLENVIIIRSPYISSHSHTPDGKYFIKDNALYLRRVYVAFEELGIKKLSISSNIETKYIDFKLCDISTDVNALTINTNE